MSSLPLPRPLPGRPEEPRRRALLALGGLGAALLGACGDGGWRCQGTPPAALRSVCGAGEGGGTTPAVPTLEMKSDAPVTVSGPITVALLFSDAVSAFSAQSLNVQGGRALTDSFTRISPREYRVQVAPYINRSGTLQIIVGPDAFMDATGTLPNADSYFFSRSYDTLMSDWVTFSDSIGNQPWTTSPLVLTMTFRIEVSPSFSLDHLLPFSGGCGLSEFTRVSDRVCTVKVTPVSASLWAQVEVPLWFVSTQPCCEGNPRLWERATWMKTISA